MGVGVGDFIGRDEVAVGPEALDDAVVGLPDIESPEELHLRDEAAVVVHRVVDLEAVA